MNKTNQEQALRYICLEKKEGCIDSLEKEIGKNTVREFELVGFIKRGETPTKEYTWKTADYAMSFYKAIYGKPTFIQKAKGIFTHYITKF